MASTRVVASSSSAASSDLMAKGVGSIGADELLRNIYGNTAMDGRTVDEAWREISGGRRGEDGEMTLEDFLARAGAVREEDVRAVAGSVFGVDPVCLGIENQVLGFGNGVEEGGDGVRVGRGRKRPAMDPVDRAALQRQKRMIKNRESAARSRERKQAYTLELETLVTQLEEENAKLLKELEEQNRERLQQSLRIENHSEFFGELALRHGSLVMFNHKQQVLRTLESSSTTTGVAFPPVAAPPPSSGGDLPSLPSDGWVSTSPTTPNNEPSPSPSSEDGIPFISSNPAVPIPTGETDTTTIRPLPMSGDGTQAVGLGWKDRIQMEVVVGLGVIMSFALSLWW
ncbi:putative transcription factor bZIP family [Dioscorea sansibarensis]